MSMKAHLASRGVHMPASPKGGAFSPKTNAEAPPAPGSLAKC